MKSKIVIFAIAIVGLCLLSAGSLQAAQNQAADQDAASLTGSTVTLLPDGTTLILGGMNSDGRVLDGAVIQSPVKALETLSSKPSYARAGHTATVLPNGLVLILGGVGSDGKVVKTAEIFDPASRSFHLLAANAPTPRAFHTATLLTDGRLLIAGGVSENGQVLASAELWDFRQKSATIAVSWPAARRSHSATLLANGEVLLQSGKDAQGSSIGSADVFDPNSQTFARAGDTQSLLPQENRAAEVTASSPQDGGTDVPTDVLISMRFSSPVRMPAINAQTVSLKGPEGAVEAQIVAAEGGMLAFVTPSAMLVAGTVYQVTLNGAVDPHDASVPFAQFTFTTAGVAPTDPEHWQPTSDWRTHAPPSPYEKLPLPQAPPGVTALAGRVLRLDGKPLPHVTLKIGQQKALTDDKGQFLLVNISPGHEPLLIDGATAKHGHDVYGLYEAAVDVVPGQTNNLSYTIWMTALDMADEVTIPSPTITETVVKNPMLPGLELRIPPDTVITGYDGKPVTKITMTPIPLDRTPFPLPDVNMPVYFTIQPGLSYIHVGNSGSYKKGARLLYPNTFSDPAGTIINLWDYDADGPGWFVYGQGRVEADGSQIVPFPGVEIYEFTGASVENAQPAPGTFPTPGCKVCSGDPVNLSTGLFLYNKTDLVVSDVIPLTLTRTYRPNDSISRAFGIGTTHPYDIFIVGDNITFGFVDLVLPDGGRIHFDCNQPPTNNTCPNSTYSHTTSPTEFYGATLVGPDAFPDGIRWKLTMKNGTVLNFPFPGDHTGTNPFKQGLMSIVDRYGNTVTVNRDPNNSKRATSIVSPNGRSISFTYDNYNHIIQASNNGGQTVNYAYDGFGRLVAVADANAASCAAANMAIGASGLPNWVTACPVTSYTYDGQHRMLTVTNPKGIQYLTNKYDGASYVIKQQTLADGSTYTFNWTFANNGTQGGAGVAQGRIYSAGTGGGGGGGGGTLTLGIQPGYLLRGCASCYAGYMPLVQNVDIQDQLGFHRQVSFGPTGYMTGDKYAVGTAQEQDYTYQNFADNLLQQVTDPMGNVTQYNYDNNGNLTSSTWLGGTSSAATTSYSYDTNGFNQLLSVTDPLSYTWSFSYDNTGNLIGASDPLSNQATFSYNSAGQVLAASDPLHNISRYSYNYLGDLVAATDPLENTTHFNFDSVGRMLSATDALNEQTSYQYDALNQVLQVTDPRGPQSGVTSFSYDANGNLLSVQDPSQQGTGLMTSYVYDNMDRVITRTDPLQRQESYQYDLAGNLVQYTKRRGNVTTLNYDALNRTTFVGFGTQPGPTYESTISYSYDSYDRLLAAADSVAGANLCPTILTNASICHTYTDMSVTPSSTETTPNGTVTYVFDQAGRRKTMSVTGQPLISYTFDPANRLTQISQATTPTATVTNFTYDADGRRSSLVLPNGVTTTYCYDADSRVTGLLYNNGLAVLCNGSPNLGALIYSYDFVGRRTQVSGTFARTGLPQPVTSAAYDAANELLQWNGQLFAYDLNGNMTSDGVNTYVWNARNQLAQINATTFHYDAFGRRTQNAAGASFLYDGADSVQELSGTTPIANRVVGGVDEFFSRTDGTGSYTPLADALGSVIGLVNSSDTLFTQYTYDPFGVATASGTANNNTFQYAGRENDGTGLYYYRARYYNPTFGRFISEDPIGFSGGINFYAYVGNSPLNSVDPSGTQQVVGGQGDDGPPIDDTPGGYDLPEPPPRPVPPGPPTNWWTPRFPHKPGTTPYVPGYGLKPEATSCPLPEPEPSPSPTPTPTATPTPTPTPTPDDECEFAGEWRLLQAGIGDPHEFKRDFLGNKAPISQWDICACKDGSIKIKARGACGSPGPSIDTGYTWK